VKCSDRDYAWILYNLPGKKAVLIICSYSEKDGTVTFDLDLKKLEIKRDCFSTNFETRKNAVQKNGKIKLNLKKHQLIAIELSNNKPEERKMIKSKINRKKKITRKAAAGIAAAVMSTTAVGMNIPGVDEDLKKNIIYYNSFNTPKKHDVSKIKFKSFRYPKKYVKDAGLSGGAVELPKSSKVGIAAKSPELGFQNNRTVTFWFKLLEKPSKNGSMSMFYLRGRGFVAAFTRSGPWCGLKQSALVTQMIKLKGIKNSNRIVDRKFAEHYPENKWHFFAITSNGKTVSTYLNGKLVSSMHAQRPFNKQDNLSNMNIFEFKSVSVLLDDLTIFDLPLTKEQLKNIYDANDAMLMRK
jgi:hypothetical protein